MDEKNKKLLKYGLIANFTVTLLLLLITSINLFITMRKDSRPDRIMRNEPEIMRRDFRSR